MDKSIKPISIAGALIILSLLTAAAGPRLDSVRSGQAGITTRTSQVTAPERFFGFPMGADRKIARWDKLVEYYRLLEKESGGKLAVVDLGPTEMGNPFLLVIITGPSNQKALETLRRNNLKLADPRGIPEGGDPEDRRREQADRLHDDEHARLRDRRGADGARAGV